MAALRQTTITRRRRRSDRAEDSLRYDQERQRLRGQSRALARLLLPRLKPLSRCRRQSSISTPNGLHPTSQRSPVPTSFGELASAAKKPMCCFRQRRQTVAAQSRLFGSAECLSRSLLPWSNRRLNSNSIGSTPLSISSSSLSRPAALDTSSRVWPR